MLLVQQVEDAAYKYTGAQRSIGEFLLSEKQRIETYSMGEIAEKTFTSKSSLVRFAKGLGFANVKIGLNQKSPFSKGRWFSPIIIFRTESG